MFITCTHSPHFLRCLSRCFNLYNSQLHLSLPLSFSAPRCSCLFIQLRLSWRRTVRSGSNFSALQLSHWVDVCFVFLLWRCRTHRIFMWETQTYCELIGSGGADTHTDRLSHFSFFLPALAFFLFYLLPWANHLLPWANHLLFVHIFFIYMFNTFATTTWLFVATLFNWVPHHFQSCEAQCSLSGKIMMLD